MYGLLIDNVLRYLRAKYHPKVVNDIIKESKIPFEEADISSTYPESYLPKISKKASLFLQVREQDLFEGESFFPSERTEVKNSIPTLISQAMSKSFLDLHSFDLNCVVNLNLNHIVSS